MSRVASAAHFVSWLALCPDNDISGGKLIVARSPKGQEPSWPFIPHAAYALHRSPTPWATTCVEESQAGPQAATMATAHKIAVIFYTMVKNQVEYDETIWDARDAQREKSWKQNSNASQTTGL